MSTVRDLSQQELDTFTWASLDYPIFPHIEQDTNTRRSSGADGDGTRQDPMEQMLSALQVGRYLDDSKSHRVYASQKTHRCNVCAENEDNHKMWYCVLRCKSTTCAGSCNWEAKVLTCLKKYDIPTPPSQHNTERLQHVSKNNSTTISSGLRRKIR